MGLGDVSREVRAGEVTCVVGYNGAGKSSLIKILSGVHPHDDGEFLVGGRSVRFSGPRDARAEGISVVFQDLATVPLMSIWRNFFLGSEPTRGVGPARRLNVKFAKNVMREEMHKIGIDVRDPDQPVGTLSGGERQAVANTRALYVRAKGMMRHRPHTAA